MVTVDAAHVTHRSKASLNTVRDAAVAAAVAGAGTAALPSHCDGPQRASAAVTYGRSSRWHQR